jgi:hypothetical protein
MCPKPVPQPRHYLSGIGQPVSARPCVISPLTKPAWGCKGLSSHRSSTPCPPAVPCYTAPIGSRSTDAPCRSLRLGGKGRAPAPLLASLARRWRVGKLANSHQWTCSGHNHRCYWSVSIEPLCISVPQSFMGIDKSLTDDFPSVRIDGLKYHYGKETTNGQYLVENAAYAKDYWCFDTREDLIAFLVMLPESADRNWFEKYPDWYDVSPEERASRFRKRRADLRQQAAEKRKNGSAGYFNILQFDEAGWYSANAFPHPSCDDVYIRCEELETLNGRKEWLVALYKGNEYGSDGPPLKFSTNQALTIASALIRAAQDVANHQKA